MLEQSLINYFTRVGGQLVVDQASGQLFIALPPGRVLLINELAAYVQADLDWAAQQRSEKPAD